MLKPTLVSIVAFDGHDESDLLALAAGAARGLEPALGLAILDSAHERDLQVAAPGRIQESNQAGVVASVAGHTIVVGNAPLFTRLGLSVSNLGELSDRLQQRGQHVLFIAVDGRTAGFIGVSDAGV